MPSKRRQEIDIVISRAAVFGGDWQRLYDETAAMREACGDAHMKRSSPPANCQPAQCLSPAGDGTMMAGADFIKTSTGKEPVSATLPVGLTMVCTARLRRAMGDRP